MLVIQIRIDFWVVALMTYLCLDEQDAVAVEVEATEDGRHDDGPPLHIS